MLDGSTLQAWSTEALELAQATISCLNNLNDRIGASDIVFEWYRMKLNNYISRGT